MAFNPARLNLVLEPIGSKGLRWFNYPTDDSEETILGDGYFTQAAKRGLRLYDLVFVSPEDGAAEPYILTIDSVDETGAATAVNSDATGSTAPAYRDRNIIPSVKVPVSWDHFGVDTYDVLSSPSVRRTAYREAVSDTEYNDTPAAIRLQDKGGRKFVIDERSDTLTADQVGAVFNGSSDIAGPINDALRWLSERDYGGSLLLPNTPNSVGRLTQDIVLPKTGSPVSLRGHGAGTVIQGGSGWSGAYIQAGDAVTGGSMVIDVSGIKMIAPVSGTYNGVQLDRANNIRLRDILIADPVTGISMSETYAAEINGCIVERATSYGIYSATACHNLKIRGGGVFASDVYGIYLDSNTFNILIDGVDLEHNYIAIRGDNVESLAIMSGYIEYCTNALFEFNACRNVIIENNLLGLSPSYQLTGITGGRFTNNTLLDMDITLDAANLDAFDVGYTHDWAVGAYPLGQPWKTPTLLNSWAQHSGQTVVGYRKDNRNRVHLRGGLEAGAAGTVVFTLPAGFRPSTVTNFSCTGAGGACWIQVQPDGDVYAVSAPSNYIALNGIEFDLY